MSYREFCDLIAPTIVELQRECCKLSAEEFEEFYDETMQECEKRNVNHNIMRIVLDTIRSSLFGTKIAS